MGAGGVEAEADVVGGPVSGRIRENGAKEGYDLLQRFLASEVGELIENTAAEGGQPVSHAIEATG